MTTEYKPRQIGGRKLHFGIDREAKIGDLLPTDNIGHLSSVIIILKAGDFADVVIKYAAADNRDVKKEADRNVKSALSIISQRADKKIKPDSNPTIHAAPPDGCVSTPCCGKNPFDLPINDLLTIDESAVTCGRPKG